MPLVLLVTPTDTNPGTDAARRVEIARRTTIGRGPDNDVVLADPNRYLSKTHCIIDIDGERCTVTDTSTNGVFLGDSGDRLQRNISTPLAEGSVLRLGSYRITVGVYTPPPAAPVAVGGDDRLTGSKPAAVDDGLFNDPLAAPIASSPGHAPLPSMGGSDDFGSFGLPPGGSGSGGQTIPDDFDLGLDPQPAPQAPGGSHPDHAPADSAFFAVPKVLAEKVPDDLDLGLPGAAPAGRALPQDFDAPLRPPPVARQREPSLAPGSAGDSAALAAFLAGLGLTDASLSDAAKLRLMRIAGETLRTVIQGLVEILAARASTKQEFRIERTRIEATRNNPLKVAGSLDEAIRILLLSSKTGFLPAKEAVDEALGDIKSHQLAVLAGMQVALRTVVERFDPASLESRLEEGSFLDGLVPATRKARYWDLFKQLYQEIAGELQEDFQRAFGDEFARAYKQKLDRP